jgi:hypothetical protein
MPRKLVYSKNYVNSTRYKESARVYSPEHCDKLREKWRISPPERRDKWNEIVADHNAKRSAKARQRTHKNCVTCKALRALDEFPKNRTSADGHNTVCFDCRKEYDLARYKKDGHEIRERVSRYRKDNRPKVNAADAAKIKMRKRATPKWLNWMHRAQIQEFYEIAAARTMQTGVEHNVDHVVPIKGKKVSGLNVPWNLQVLTALANQRKHASFTEE